MAGKNSSINYYYGTIIGQSDGPSMNEIINKLKVDIEDIKSGNSNVISSDPVDMSIIKKNIATLQATLVTLNANLNNVTNDVSNCKAAISSLRGTTITLTNSLNQLAVTTNNKIALIQMAVLSEQNERISQFNNLLTKIDFLYDWFFRANSDEIIL